MSAIVRLPADYGRRAEERHAERPHSLIDLTAGYLSALSAELRRRRRQRELRRRRLRTAAIVADLPRQIQADIGWPWRYVEESRDTR